MNEITDQKIREAFLHHCNEHEGSFCDIADFEGGFLAGVSYGIDITKNAYTNAGNKILEELKK